MTDSSSEQPHRTTAEPEAAERPERSFLVELAIRRPVTIFIGAVAAIVFGLVAFQQLATDLLPDVTYPSLTVRTELPGAAPVEVETLVTRPVEDAVGVVGNLVRVESSSRPEISEVTLEFGLGHVDGLRRTRRARAPRRRAPAAGSRAAGAAALRPVPRPDSASGGGRWRGRSSR